MAPRLAARCLCVLILMIIALYIKLYASLNIQSDGLHSRRHVIVRLNSGQALSADCFAILIHVIRSPSKSKRERRRLSAPTTYYANCSATFRVNLKLDIESWPPSLCVFICGDVERNPGPSCHTHFSQQSPFLNSPNVAVGLRYVTNDVTNDVVVWPPTAAFVCFVLPGGLTVYHQPVIRFSFTYNQNDLFQWQHYRRPSAEVFEKLAVLGLLKRRHRGTRGGRHRSDVPCC
jgi:hypothetical protein